MWGRLIPIIMVLSMVLTACQELTGFPTPTPSPTPRAEPRRTLVVSEDRAVMAVQEYLLSKAISARAKAYLTELYASGGKWSARSELLKDGTRTWNVMLETEGKPEDKIKPQWRAACWTVFDDGKVLPSPKYDASALRIEADLQELSGGA